MDNEPITAHQIGYTYMINSSTFAKRYKDTLSDFETWEQNEHATEWVLLPQNAGKEHGIDETSLQGELYTIVHNKDAHGRKGAIIAVVKGTNPADVLRVLMQLPADKREMVESITMDLSDCMRAIAREAFPNATVIRDCFHVVKRGGEGCEEIRLRLKREAVKELNRQKTKFRKYLEGLAAQRKAYRERMMAKHGRKWKKSKRGKKPKRLNTRFEPPRLTNGETLVEALTRCRRQLSMSREKWSLTQEKRAKTLFELHPKLEEAYNLIIHSDPYSATRNSQRKLQRRSWESGMIKLPHALCERSSPYVTPLNSMRTRY